MHDKIVLAYSGGLDTSVCIQWLKENYSADIIAVTIDLGGDGEQDLDFIREKGLKVGAEKCYVIDAKDEFTDDFLSMAIQANAYYEEDYFLATALGRPLIVKKMIEVAEKENATAIAHGCTGKGNDQVRFDVAAKAMNPEMEIIAPVREWSMSRNEEISYARENGIPIPVDVDSPYSTDVNMWGRSIECGVLEDPWQEPPEEVFEWTEAPEDAPEQAENIEIRFEQGIPVELNGEKMSPANLIKKLNKTAGQHGLGRVDHVENRLVGIKSREIYEGPAAVVILEAHRQLEDLTLTKDLMHYKRRISDKFSELVYNGLWFTPLMESLQSFIESSQKTVTGTVRLKMYRGGMMVTGRKSPFSLYDLGLATYDDNDQFDHQAAEGFIDIWSMPSQVYASVMRKNDQTWIQKKKND